MTKLVPLVIKIFVSLTFLVAYISCESKSATTPVAINFYHWKNQLNISSSENAFLKALDSKKLYLRFFDVDWDFNQKDAVPVSVLSIKNIPGTTVEIVPAVFITNRTFLNLPAERIDQLANRLFNKIESLTTQFSHLSIAEVQLDCDWSPKTRINYFIFLKKVKTLFNQNNWNLSVTIRLHQLKFPKKTGIPPADRGVLMCYNVDDVIEWNTENSILDEEVTYTYLSNHPDYPLPLNVALPVFRWGVLFRDGKMIKLLNGLDQQELTDSVFYQQTKPSRYKIRKSTYLHGHYLYPGDKIRLEKTTIPQLEAVAIQLAATLPTTKQREIIFYHLDTMIVNTYSVADFNKIARIFDQ